MGKGPSRPKDQPMRGAERSADFPFRKGIREVLEGPEKERVEEKVSSDTCHRR